MRVTSRTSGKTVPKGPLGDVTMGASMSTKAWLLAFGLVDVGLAAAILLIARVPPGAVGLSAAVVIAGLVLRIRRVRLTIRGNEVVIANRWVTHRIPVASITSLHWSAIAWGRGPTVVGITTRRRVKPFYVRRVIAIESTAAFNADRNNETRHSIARRLRVKDC